MMDITRITVKSIFIATAFILSNLWCLTKGNIAFIMPLPGEITIYSANCLSLDIQFPNNHFTADDTWFI